MAKKRRNSLRFYNNPALFHGFRYSFGKFSQATQFSPDDQQ